MMKWKREMDDSISINTVVKKYVCEDFCIELEYGSLSSNRPSGFDLYKGENFIGSYPTLSEAKIFAEMKKK